MEVYYESYKDKEKESSDQDDSFKILTIEYRRGLF